MACRPAPCTFPGCTGLVKARGLCNSHWQQWHKHGETWVIGSRTSRAGGVKGRRPSADVAEDAEFMAANGENVEGIVRRLGYSNVDSLERALRRANRLDVWRKLQADSPAIVRTHKAA